MAITHIHSYLVHPGKHLEEQPTITGAAVPLKGKLFDMLRAMYDDAELECDIEIIFRPAADGSQQNPCRTLLIDYVNNSTVPHGRAIANRLQLITTNRSGLGLLFCVKGVENAEHQLLVSRFPADQGILAEEQKHSLKIEFIERIFMKSAYSFKSALFVGQPTAGNFWIGRAVDRQINAIRELSNYWISDFLDCDLRSTGPAGTKRLALALKQAIRSTKETLIKDELISAAKLLRNQNGKMISLQGIGQQLGLSDQSILTIKESLPNPEIFGETFEFVREEFDQHLPYRSVELDNGAFMVAEAASFEEVFVKQALERNDGVVRFSTEGRIVDQELRKTK